METPKPIYENVQNLLQREYLMIHSHCVLCGGYLELQHTRGSSENEILEEARCPGCEIKTRTKSFTLH